MEGRRSRNVLSFGLTFLACLLTFWFAAGQGIANLDEFVAGSFEVLRGYSSAMVLSGPAGWAVAALIIWALAVVGRIGRGPGLPSRVESGSCSSCWASVSSPGRRVSFAGPATWPSSSRGCSPPGLRFGGGSAIRGRWPASPACAVLFSRPPESAQGSIAAGRERQRPRSRTSVTMFEPARRNSVRTQALERHAVGIRPRPTDPGAASGEDRPRVAVGDRHRVGIRTELEAPADLQTYGAYTPWLDDRNAATLASAEGPQRILRHLTNPGAAGGPPPLYDQHRRPLRGL